MMVMMIGFDPGGGKLVDGSWRKNVKTETLLQPRDCEDESKTVVIIHSHANNFQLRSKQRRLINMNEDLKAMNQLYENTPGSEELEEQYLCVLLKSAIEKNSPAAIDVLMKLYPTFHPKQAYVKEFFQESMKQQGIDVLKCLLKHFAHKIANDSRYL